MDEDTQSTSRRPIGNDNQPPLITQLVRDLVMGWRFYTRLPSGRSDHESPDVARMAPVLAPVSLLIGLGPALLVVVLAMFGMPVLPASVMGLLGLIVITGAMSEDALADSFDGLWGGHDRARRLEIMHDSTHGTYGVLAITGSFALRMSLLVILFVGAPVQGVILWIAAQILSRQLSLWLPFRLGPARPDGVAHAAGRLPDRQFWLGFGVAMVLFLAATAPLIGILGSVAALGTGAIIALIWERICLSKVGGYTGDLIGGLQALVEIGLLSAFILFV